MMLPVSSCFRLLRLFCLSLLSLAVAGCSSMGLEFENPFSTTSDINDVYLSQFPDIPIPSDMESVTSRSLVTPNQNGEKVGLETFEGRVEASSLANAMIHHLSRQGWSLRGSTTGKRTMQLHQKDQRYAVIYLYEQTLTTAMEVWVISRLHDSSGLSASDPFGLPSGSAVGDALSGLSPASTVTEQWEGGIETAPLMK